MESQSSHFDAVKAVYLNQPGKLLLAAVYPAEFMHSYSKKPSSVSQIASTVMPVSAAPSNAVCLSPAPSDIPQVSAAPSDTPLSRATTPPASLPVSAATTPAPSAELPDFDTLLADFTKPLVIEVTPVVPGIVAPSWCEGTTDQKYAYLIHLSKNHHYRLIVDWYISQKAGHIYAVFVIIC